MTTLAFNIKGAFDRVTDAYFIKRLWKQGILLSIIRWVVLFLKDRIAVVRLDTKIGDQKPVKIEVPQRLPVASIFFMLFIALLFKILTKKKNCQNKDPRLHKQ